MRTVAERDAFRAAGPFVLTDAERIEDLHAELGRTVRALLRDHPYATLGGAVAAGFLLGGGFRTRLGRFMLRAAGRYVLVHAVEGYLGM